MKMVKKVIDDTCCAASTDEAMGCCCRVEAVIGVDERGQMVLPKDMRDKAGIRPGDKLAVISWEKGDQVHCISLIKVDHLAEMVKGMLGPVMKEILQD